MNKRPVSEKSTYEVLLSLAKSRYSCRAFDGRPVSRKDIEKILVVARTAPSDCNTQPATLFIVSGAPLEGLRNEMFEAFDNGAQRISDVPPIGTYPGVYQERRRECAWALYGAVGVRKGNSEGSARQARENFRFFNAPHLAVVTAHEGLMERGIFDTGIYLGHFLLAAQAAGVDAIAQGAIAHYADVIRRYVPIPRDLRIICGVSFGHGLAEHPANSFRTSRAGLTDTTIFVG